ncbi:hypothetical protein M8R20_06725 [Pseudomonas sp. R2.Fl]|nr:hypothetical protein [Pseudomonas sp. R2.Fl]
MRGLHKRKGSDIWQGRFRIPSNLWNQRKRLLELGVKNVPKAQEHSRSTGKLDRDEATVAYRAALNAWDAKMAAWLALLENGPQGLTFPQQLAVAADYARAFLLAHEDDPFSVPSPAPLPEPPEDDGRAWAAMVSKMAPAERKAFMEGLRAALRERDEERRSHLAFNLLCRYPALKPLVRSDLAAALEATHGADRDAALAAKGLHVDAGTRRALLVDVADFMGVAQRGVEAMQGGYYTKVKELEAAPVFVATVKAPAASGKVETKFTFAGIVEAETVRRALGRDAKPFPERTPKKYSKHGEEFAAWRRSQGLSKSASTDARTVTREEVERWRTSMQSDAELSNRTINGKVAGISTIIMWGMENLKLQAFHTGGNPLGGLKKLDFATLDSDARTYRLEEAVAVLKAACKETEARRRWLPWVCAYTGMRIEEAGQLGAEDFFNVEGRWFLRVSTSGRRSLKTASSQRRIPLHPSLEAEGLMDFVRSVGKGRLFKSNRIQPLMSEWIRETVGLTRPELAPNHGWRHFFEDLCGRSVMPDSARDYMTGRASGKSRDLYGKSELMLPGLAEAMDKVPDILGLAGRTGAA